MTNPSGTNLDSRKAGPAGTGSRDGVRSEILIDKIGQPDVITASDGSLTVTVPIRIKRRGSRKAVALPDGSAVQPRPWDDTPTPIQLRARPRPPLAGDGRVRRGAHAFRGGRARGDGSGLCEPDGEPHHPGAGHRGCDPRRNLAAGGDPVRSGVGDATVVGGAAGSGEAVSA